VVLPQPVSPEIRTTWQEKPKDQITITHQMAVKEKKSCELVSAYM
jgi:hypothetical protein